MILELNNMKFELHSGGAYGADHHFQKQAEKLNQDTICHSFEGHNRIGDYDKCILYSKKILLQEKGALKEVLRYFDRSYPIQNYTENLLLRNAKIIDKCDLMLAVGELSIDNFLIPGGTSYGVIYALLDVLDNVYYYDQNKKILYTIHANQWEWEDTGRMTYSVTETSYRDIKKYLKGLQAFNHIEKLKIAGVGTRKLNKAGEKFIEEILELIDNI
jgi:hypothetical protein